MCLYQETIMAYLVWLGEPEDETYTIIKKIAKKKFKAEELKELKDKLEKQWIDKVGSNKYFEENWQVVQDAARYSFNCISGDTQIQRFGQKTNTFNPTIEEMYLIKNDKEYAKKTNHLSLHKKYNLFGYGNALSMFEDNRIHKNKIIDIYYTGKQKIYRVTTSSGSYVDCTMNHSFPTLEGKKKLSELCIGDSLYVKGIYEKHPDNYRFTDGNFEKNIPKKGEMGFQIKEDGNCHKFYAYYNENLKNENSCSMCNKKYDGSKFEVHHIDHDRTNNEHSNLIWLCNSCHKLKHYQDGRTKVMGKGIPTYLDKIVAIEYLREDDVYDIEMENPAHNFISKSGLVVSNCSHSLSYAYDSIYGAYLKSHYPLEYYTVVLNLYQGDFERTNKLTQELNYFKIKMSEPKFRYSFSKYSCDKKTNTIYKGISSIKGLSKAMGEKLNELKDKNYTNFYEFLKDCKEMSIGFSDLTILIKLDYFSEFGKIKKLLHFIDIYTELYGKKLIKKDKEYQVKTLFLKEYCAKETDKQYSGFDYEKCLVDLYSMLPNEDIPIKEKMNYQIAYYGYVDVIDENEDANIWFVSDIENRSKNKFVSLYKICDGTKVQAKCKSKIFEANPFEIGDILQINNISNEGKWIKDEEGNWTRSTTDFENFLNSFLVIK